MFPASVSASFLVILRKDLFSCRGVRPALIAAGIMVVSLLAATFTEDFSWDGNYYHQEMVITLTEGWNPVYEMDRTGLIIWTMHYAKGVELIASTIVSATGFVESGKAVNLIMIAAMGALSAYAIRRLLPDRSRTVIVAMTLFVVANPVVILQSMTYYIDYTKYCYFVFTLIYVLLLSRDSNRRGGLSALMLGGVVILAVATKFNIFFEEGLLIALIVAWLACRRDSRRAASKIAAISVLAAIIGVILCVHPYVTNVMTGGNPFYPLMGNGAIDIMNINTPEIYAGHGRVVNFFIGLLGVSGVLGVDTRVGAFTPLMFFMLVASLAGLVCVRRKIGGVWLYAAVMLTLSCFMFEQSWWGRYICQIWLVPVIGAVGLASTDIRLWRRVSSWICAGGLIIGLYACSVAAMRVATFTQLRYDIYDAVEKCGQGFVEIKDANASSRRHWSERGVKVIETDSVVPPMVYFYGTDPEKYPYPIIQLSDCSAGMIAPRSDPISKYIYRERYVKD